MRLHAKVHLSLDSRGCGLQPISHRTLSGFRSDHKEGLENLFVQVVGMLSAEGLITMQRVTLDGTKIKANASGNTFRRKEKIEAHLALAREQVQKMNEQAAEEEKVAKRQSAAKRRAARQRVSRLEAAFREVERLQESKKHDRGDYVARASTTDPEAHVKRNGEGGTVPSYNVQLVTDTTHGLIVNVEATTDAIDYRQSENELKVVSKVGMPNVGIVYDYEHGRPQMDRFAVFFPKLVPHLWAVILNGMQEGGADFITVGDGDRDLGMLKVIRDSGYSGPIGIMNHDENRDAEVGLRSNMEGLKKMLREMNDQASLGTY